VETQRVGESPNLPSIDMKNDEKRQNPQKVMKTDFQQSVIELILQPGIIIWDKSSQMVTDNINKKKKKILFKDFK
jgi:hypothetical protein